MAGPVRLIPACLNTEPTARWFAACIEIERFMGTLPTLCAVGLALHLSKPELWSLVCASLSPHAATGAKAFSLPPLAASPSSPSSLA